MDGEREKRLAQLRQAFENGFLDEDTYRAAVAGLEGATTYEAKVESGAVAQGIANMAAGAGAVQVRGNVQGNIYMGQPTDDPAEALRIYCEVLVQSGRYLPLRGVDVGASDATTGQNPLNLVNVYIDLNTTNSVWRAKHKQEQLPDGEEIQNVEELLDVEQGTRPLAALEAVKIRKQLVLLGDPGSGKSTFVNHLAYCLAAHRLEPAANWLARLSTTLLHDRELNLLPLPVVLRDFANSLPDPLPDRATPAHLWQFMVDCLHSQNLDFAGDSIRAELQAGRAFLLLDGLDEIAAPKKRAFVRDAVLAFANRYPAARCLVTCRVLSYQPPPAGKPDTLRLPAEEFPSYELAPFDEKQIDRFVQAWYDELARLSVVRSQDVGSLAGRLRAAVRRPDLRPLASNPLLLTVMALVHTHKGELPDARALLYEDTIEMLLWRWEQVKLGQGAAGAGLRALLREAGQNDLDLKRALWQLAYEVHQQGGSGDQASDISEGRLQRALLALKEGDYNWAHQVIEAMKLRAGLLLERAPETFTFPHRTFQEYLAGAHLAAQGNFARQAAALAGQGNLWREVILLAVGRLVYLGGDTDRPLALVAELCPAEAADEPAAWRNAWLAGDVLLEIGPQRASQGAMGRDLLARVRGRLADLVAGGKLAPRERAEAGDTLARLGDLRPGVGVVQVGQRTLPDIELCYVPAGPFWMGSGSEDKMAREDEKPLHQLNIPYDYWIGRYPVTVAQFRAFVEDSGQQLRDRDNLADPSNRPVRWITWDYAMAFAHWLAAAWTAAGWLPAGWTVRLPSEAEWEKAARGGLLIPAQTVIQRPDAHLAAAPAPVLRPNLLPQRIYPWGNEIELVYANNEETRIGAVCAAGAFPAGASPYGALDLGRNQWEWTHSLYQQYPYQPEDGREDLTSREARVLRGGAFYSEKSGHRCSFRDWDIPDYFDWYHGFRVLLSPSSSSLASVRSGRRTL